MDEVDRLEAEIAKLKRALTKKGFQITYRKTGEINRIIAPRKPAVRHTAAYWAAQRGFTGSISAVRRSTKNKAITYRKFKNEVKRAELIKDTESFLKNNGYQVPSKLINRIPTYVLEHNDFHSNLSKYAFYTVDEDQKEVDQDGIREAIMASTDRIKKTREPTKKTKKKPGLKLK